MNEEKIMTYKELIDAVNADKIARIESAQKFDLICQTLDKWDPNKTATLESKCDYIISNLNNIKEHMDSGFREELEADKENGIRLLSQSKSELEKSIAELEGIKKAVNFAFDEKTLDDYSKSIVFNIDKQLNNANKVLELSNNALNDKFDLNKSSDKEEELFNVEVNDEVKEEVPEISTPVEEPLMDFEPANIDAFEFENIERDLNNDIKPIQEDQDMLKELSKELDNNDAQLVTDTEDVKAPVLMPAEQQSLENVIDNMQKESEQEIAPVTENMPIADVATVKPIESAASVDDGYVLVAKQEAFGFGSVDSTVEEDNQKTLSRAA